MEPKLDYFFHNIGDFPLPQAFAEVQYPWEALEKADTIGREVPLWGFPPAETPPRDVCISGPCAIGRNTVIGPGTVIQGPAVIGEDCLIQPGVLIRPGTVIGNHCVIGHGCEIKHSIVASHAKLQSMSFVGDSLIGRSARVGSGVILANRRFDQAPIGATKTAFFGCVLGDYARLGANSVTQPGTLIGPYTWVYPGTALRGFIPECKRVYHPRPLIMDDHRPLKLKD